MPSTNGHAPKRAILYTRVSGEEQKKKGYSLPDQLRTLREWCKAEGYEVLEEVEDGAWSGGFLERPGLDRVREMVATGEVDAVVVLFRDRIARGVYAQLLQAEFAEHGTRLIALNSVGDDSPDGELSDAIMDVISGWQRKKTAELSRRGKREKALRGETVGHLRPPLGFEYTPDRKGLEVNSEKMAVVRRIFEMAAGGSSLLAIKKALERDGIPTPKGGRTWSLGTLHTLVHNDVYRSRSVEELRAIVPPGVADTLDPEKRYGVWWYGRQRHHLKQTVDLGPDGAKRYRKGRRSEDLPQEQWLAIPVPDCGLHPQLVEAARTARADHRKPATTGYFWQLSGGIMRCGGCGHAMSGVTSPPNKKDGFRLRYYRCHHRARNGVQACPNGKGQRADRIEAEVWEEVSGLLKNPERLRIGIKRVIEEKKNALRGNPTRELKHWHAELQKAERMRSSYLDQHAEGIIETMAELKAKLAVVDERRRVAERELQKLSHCQEEIAKLERDVEALIERYRFEACEGLDLFTPQDRHEAYKTLGINVIAHPDGTAELTGRMLPDVNSDSICSKPIERSHSPLSTGARRPLLTVTPPVESR